MTARLRTNGKAFKRAMIYSAAAHSLILALIVLNPSLPKPQKKGLTIYIPTNFIGMLGGGGGGGGGIKAAPKKELGATEVKKETLRDLTTLQKLQQDEPKSSLRFPVDKPKKEPSKKAEKKAAITKPDASAKATAKETAASAGGQKAAGGGSGLTINVGGPGGGEGTGSGFPGQLGSSNFPFMYYLQEIQIKIQSNWFTSLVDPGVSGSFHVDVYFRIYRDGSISTIDIKESSGIDTLDKSAVRAVMRSAKFPPLPVGYDEDYLGIYLRFEHSK